MTVDPKCVWKHVSHDWKEAGRYIAYGVGLIAAIAAGMFLVVALLTYATVPLESGIAAIATIFTAANVLNLSTCWIFVYFTLGIALFWDKDSFITSSDGDGDYSGEHPATGTLNTWYLCVMIIALEMMMIVAYGIYGASYGNLYPSPTLLFALFIVGIFAITPICCAIARCKE